MNNYNKIHVNYDEFFNSFEDTYNEKNNRECSLSAGMHETSTHNIFINLKKQSSYAIGNHRSIEAEIIGTINHETIHAILSDFINKFTCIKFIILLKNI